MKTYKISTAAGGTEFLEADRVELDDHTVTFFLGDEPVGRFTGASSWSIVKPVPDVQ